MNTKREGATRAVNYLSVLSVLIMLGFFTGDVFGADSFLTPLGPIAEAERTHLIRVIGITMIAIVPGLVGVPLILWRYRRGNKRAVVRPHSRHHAEHCWPFGGCPNHHSGALLLAHRSESPEARGSAAHPILAPAVDSYGGRHDLDHGQPGWAYVVIFRS